MSINGKGIIQFPGKCIGTKRKNKTKSITLSLRRIISERIYHIHTKECPQQGEINY